MLNIDFTLAIQLINFLVLLILMNIFLYRPIRGILAKRQTEKGALENAIEDLKTRIAQNEKGIEEGRIQAGKEGFSEIEAQKNSGLENEHEVLQKAISKAEEKVGGARREIEAKMSDARRSLEGQVGLFSKDLAEKILGRSIL